MTAPELKEIEIGNTLEDQELSLIKDLEVKAFDVDANVEDIKEFKENLKTTKINVITSASGETETKEEKTLWEIAEQFDQYVEKGEWWKLKIKEGSTNTPAWITYIIDNPKNNDLAYLVQKLAWLILYKTAKAYTEEEIDAVDVSIDKTFGNQTRRALAGLKAWIENEWDYKSVAEWTTYTGKYLDKSFVEWVVSTQTTDQEKNTALIKYNLQYKDGEIQPKDGYEFIDPYSNNIAVKVAGNLVPENVQPAVNVWLAVNSWKLDAFNNTIMTMTNINQLPIWADGLYTWPAEKKLSYKITFNGVDYDFYNNGRVWYDWKGYSSKSVIDTIFKKELISTTKTIGIKKQEVINDAEVRTISSVNELLPLIDKNGEYRWTENKVYECVISWKTFRFYNNNRVVCDDQNTPNQDSNTFITNLHQSTEKSNNTKETLITDIKDVPVKIDAEKKYTKRNYNSRWDIMFYSDGHFVNGYDNLQKEVRGNRYKMADGSTIMKYDNWIVECSKEVIDKDKKINYEVLQNILTIIASWGEEYGINTSGVLMKWKQSPQDKFYPAWYYVKKWNLYKSIKNSWLTYAYQYIYDKKTDDFIEIGEYVTSWYSWSYQIKEQYKV